ncbi:hypothetical protein X801_10387, partial [Opisthorchis viverrini]
MIQDTLSIICISYFTAFLGEGLTWLFVYRTEKYQKLKAEVDKQSKRQKQEERLKNINRELSMLILLKPSSLVRILLHFIPTCSFRFDGRVVTKLPFVPMSWLRSLSHRNLPGDDFTDGSFIFIYILCTMSIRQ